MKLDITDRSIPSFTDLKTVAQEVGSSALVEIEQRKELERLRPKMPGSPSIAAAFVQRLTHKDPVAAKAVVETTIRVLDGAADLLKTDLDHPYRKYQGRTDPNLVREIATKLTNAAKQLDVLDQSADVRAAISGGQLKEQALELKLAYGRLLFAMAGHRSDLLEVIGNAHHIDRFGGEGGFFSIAKPDPNASAAVREMIGSLTSTFLSSSIFVGGMLDGQRHQAQTAQTLFPYRVTSDASPPGQAATEYAALKKAAEQHDDALFSELLGGRDTAKQLFRDVVLDLMDQVGAKHPDVGIALTQLGDFETRQGRPDKASRAYEGAVAVLRETLGPKHPRTAEAATKLMQTAFAWRDGLTHPSDISRAEDTILQASRRLKLDEIPPPAAADPNAAPLIQLAPWSEAGADRPQMAGIVFGERAHPLDGQVRYAVHGPIDM